MGEIKKKCFVITPIGDNNSEIRRHIDGIIDQSIIPAFGEKYDIDVAHRKYEIGSINDRVIRSVFEADLVVANLTNLNPNVMFELAIRYSHGKPAIVIAEYGTKLPFDIVDENTIFYFNDPTGANELKTKLIEFENNIDYKKQTYGPVYKAISKIPLYNEVELGRDVSNEKMLEYIIERLNSIEFGATNHLRPKTYDFQIDVKYKRRQITDQKGMMTDICDLLKFYDCYFPNQDIESGFVFYLKTKLNEDEQSELYGKIENVLRKYGYTNIIYIAE